MFEIIGLIIVGFGIGACGTLIGIGGGPLIVPFLLIFYKLQPADIVATSMLVVLFNVVSGSFAYYRQKRIDIISGTKFGLATIPGAILGTFIPQFYNDMFLRIVFGVLTLILAVYVLKKGKKDVPPVSVAETADYPEEYVKRTITDKWGNRFVYSFNEKLGLCLSAGIGFIATMLGIGGGVIHVPMLNRLLNFPVHIATATAHYKLFICSLFGSVFYVARGYVVFSIAIPMGIGAVIGARLGAKLSKNISGKKIFKILGFILLLLALRLILWPLR